MSNWDETPEQPRRHWNEFISHLTSERLRILQEKLEDIAEVKDILATLFSLLSV